MQGSGFGACGVAVPCLTLGLGAAGRLTDFVPG